jgi:hypothetical protein
VYVNFVGAAMNLEVRVIYCDGRFADISGFKTNGPETGRPCGEFDK